MSGNESTGQLVKVKLPDGSEKEMTTEELLEQHVALLNSNASMQAEFQQMKVGMQKVEATREWLEQLDKDPAAAIQKLYQAAVRKGVKIDLGNDDKPRSEITNDDFGYDEGDDEMSEELKALVAQQAEQIAELQKQLETVDLRGVLTEQINKASKEHSLDANELRQYMLDNEIGRVDIAVKAMQSDKSAAEQAQAAADRAAAEAQAAEEESRTDTIRSLLNAGDGVTAAETEGFAKDYVKEDGSFDLQATIRDSMRASGMSV